MISLADDFHERIVSVFGDDGRTWLTRLPAIIDEYAARWELQPEAPFELSYNYVAPATRRDGTPAVLKAGVPREQLWCEIAALRHWDGDGTVRVLESDAAAGVFLMERVYPGTMLLEEDDDAEATQVAAGLMRRLRRPLPEGLYGFPTLLDWSRAFDELRARHGGSSGPLDEATYERGEALFRELAAAHVPAVVLHGDLHHWNVLAGEREPWLVIDPHGVVGDPAFEIAAWMRNPAPGPGEKHSERALLQRRDVRRALARRLDIFAEVLGEDRDHLRDWSIAFCALSASWSDESGHRSSAEQAMAVAAHLIAL